MDLIDYSAVLLESINVLEECFNKYKTSEVFLAFNGGKDCTVLLHVALEFLKNKFNVGKEYNDFRVFYIQPENSFPELDDFISQMQNKYNLNLTTIPGSIKQALIEILQNHKGLKACLMGTRRSDPFSERLQFFEMTDEDWPQVMRVSPILKWSYHEIWSYLIAKEVPYCKLYNLGYTSIGNVNNTVPNPHLKIESTSENRIEYKPAYLLENGELERAGRGVNTTIQNGH